MKTTPSLLSAKRDIWQARFYRKLTPPWDLSTLSNRAWSRKVIGPKVIGGYRTKDRSFGIMTIVNFEKVDKLWVLLNWIFIHWLTEICTQIWNVEGSDQTKTLDACYLLVGCPVRTNNVLTQTLLVRIEQPTSKQQATNVPKTEKHNRSKFGVPMPLENILKCRSTVTLLERDDQTTPKSPHIPPSYSFHGASNTMKLPHNSSCPFKISDIPRFSLKRVKIR